MAYINIIRQQRDVEHQAGPCICRKSQISELFSLFLLLLYIYFVYLRPN